MAMSRTARLAQPRAALESLTSPFWTAFALTLTQTFGASVLALPIAVAGLGPVPGLVAIVTIGLVNMLTMAAFVEAFSRDRRARTGDVLLGGLVESYLGKAVSLAVRILLLGLLLLLLSAYYIGVASTLGSELPVSPLLVAALMFLVGLIFLLRNSLRAAVSASLIVGGINIVLILVIIVISLRKLHPAYLAFADTPFYGGHHFYFRVTGLLVGVLLTAYFGHLAVGTAAADVLRRDSSGRALLWGCLSAQATVLALYALWIIAVNGVVPRQSLMGDKSTALVPLSAVVGTGVRAFGIAFVVLAMGIASIQYSIALRDMVREWLPRHGPRLIVQEPVRGWVAAAPVALVFLATEWFLWRDVYSFSGLLAYIGIAVVSIVAGILPLFLLAATRRKGDRVPETIVSALGHHALIYALFFIFVAVIVIHGVIIWTNPEERVSAVLIGSIIIAMSAWIVRTGELKPRLIVDVCVEQGRRRVQLSAMSHGSPLPAEWMPVCGGAPSPPITAANTVLETASLDAIECAVPSDGVGQLQVRVRRDTGAGSSEPLSASVDVIQSGRIQRSTIDGNADSCLIPVHDHRLRARISLTA